MISANSKHQFIFSAFIHPSVNIPDPTTLVKLTISIENEKLFDRIFVRFILFFYKKVVFYTLFVHVLGL